ncbi:hypothetical protein LguiA_001941 [Lonicera macranthoides]
MIEVRQFVKVDICESCLTDELQIGIEQMDIYMYAMSKQLMKKFWTWEYQHHQSISFGFIPLNKNTVALVKFSDQKFKFKDRGDIGDSRFRRRSSEYQLFLFLSAYNFEPPIKLPYHGGDSLPPPSSKGKGKGKLAESSNPSGGIQKKSLSQAPIYVRPDRDEDGPFIKMKSSGEIGSKSKIIQGSSHQRTHSTPSFKQPEEKGVKGMLWHILKKMDYIGQNQVKLTHNQVKLERQIHQIGSYLELESFAGPFDEEAGVPEVPGNLFEEEESDSLIRSMSEGSDSDNNGED